MQRLRVKRSTASVLAGVAALGASVGCGPLLGIDDVSRAAVGAAGGPGGGAGGSPGGSAGGAPGGTGGAVAGGAGVGVGGSGVGGGGVGGSGVGGTGGVGGGGGTGGGTGGAGGQPLPSDSFVRFANLFTDDNQFKPYAFDLCTRALPDGPWVGPALHRVGGQPLAFGQATDHLVLEAGVYEVRALVAPAVDCAAAGDPEMTFAPVVVEPGEYQTVAVVGDFFSAPLLAVYADGRPGQGSAVVEFALAHALTGTDEGVRFEPGAIAVAPLEGVRTPPLGAGERTLESLFFDGFRFAPAAQVPFINGLGYSLFVVSDSMLTTYIDPRGIVCVNSPRESLPNVPAPSEQCVPLEFKFVDFE
ncbi:MAG TPA: hypothetical protein VFS00_22015 [Polyangiaceae bacterium]|nr:hypothetical protein [Polyangiaceae bacterium]